MDCPTRPYKEIPVRQRYSQRQRPTVKSSEKRQGILSDNLIYGFKDFFRDTSV